MNSTSTVIDCSCELGVAAHKWTSSGQLDDEAEVQNGETAELPTLQDETVSVDCPKS